MFYNCNSLSSLDISNFNTEIVTSMEEMFRYCTLLSSLDLSNFNTQNVITMERMFYNCRSLYYLDISNFIFKKETDIFNSLPNNCYIKMNNKSNIKINTVPSTCQILMID